MKALVFVEGHGEVQAMQNLLVRVGQRLGFPLPWSNPLRWPNLHQWEAQRRGGVRAAVEFARGKGDQIGAVLIVRDEDDLCPAEEAPRCCTHLARLGLPFPVAYVLLKPEYEVLFLPCLSQMEDLGFPRSIVWDRPHWEARRDVKGWLSAQLPSGRSYKPTVMQLPMTRKIDLAQLERANVPCFGTLLRSISFLSSSIGTPGVVYPDPETNPK